MRSRVLALVGAATIAVTVLAGCSSSSKSSGSSSSSSGGSSASSSASSSSSGGGSASFESAVGAFITKPTKIDAAPAVGKPIPKGKKFVQISGGTPYDQTLTSAFKEATTALGWQFSSLQAKLTDPSTTISDLTTAINEKADFVELAATPLVIFQNVLPAARASHTLIISVAGAETGPPPEGVVYLQNGVRNFTEAGKVLTDAAVADAGGKSVNLVTTEVPQLGASQPAFTSSARTELAAKCPGCKLDTTKIPFGDILATKGAADVVAYLQSHPKTNYLLCSNGASASGLAQAITAAGLPSIKILGYSPGPDDLKDVSTGANVAWLESSFRLYAWEAVDIAVRSSVGEQPWEWSPGHWLLYKGNIAQLNSPIDPVYPDDYKAQISKLWGI